MTSRLDRRTATLLAAVALPPLAFLATGQSPAPPLAAGASILAVSAALAILERDLRTAGLASVSVATAILALYGTGLVWHEVAEPDLTPLTLVGGTLLVRAWSHRVSRERAAARRSSPRATSAGRSQPASASFDCIRRSASKRARSSRASSSTASRRAKLRSAMSRTCAKVW